LGRKTLNNICETLGIEFPLFAFSHCRDVVAAVSKAGGFGVLGATAFNPEQLELELAWIDANVDGKPYGVDVLIPENLSVKDEKDLTAGKLAARIPQQHLDFTAKILSDHGVSTEAIAPRRDDDAPPPFWPDEAMELLTVAFRHPIKMIVNALGAPPPEMVAMGRAHGVPVGALAGAKEHALRLVNAGCDVIVAQGGEAGGHCGEVATIVLIPEVVRALRAAGHGDVPVLAAGGIMTGEQMAACMAMGAAGAWTGSVWLATTESECSPLFRDKMVAARSRDTVRSKGRTGKFSRQLRSAWTDAWEGDDSPGALPMPMQSLIAEPAIRHATKSAEGGNQKALPLVTYFVGQGVGLVGGVTSARSVVQSFMEEFAEAAETLGQFTR
jgi:NAD(P)H-dependent flavin oxidoreductase YrpB (nitropropane dioxygenase family)